MSIWLPNYTPPNTTAEVPGAGQRLSLYSSSVKVTLSLGVAHGNESALSSSNSRNRRVREIPNGGQLINDQSRIKVPCVCNLSVIITGMSRQIV